MTAETTIMLREIRDQGSKFIPYPDDSMDYKFLKMIISDLFRSGIIFPRELKSGWKLILKEKGLRFIKAHEEDWPLMPTKSKIEGE